ncbi:MAG: uncharacterized membrane protein HdeD (DUF308 family) [Sulfitobacter sp.]|jgi:uncharacterized membrane protein HdeD (DUF308 family)
MSEESIDSLPDVARRIASGLRVSGIIFVVLGLLAVAIPAIATLLIEQLIAWVLVLWGIAGVVYAFNFRQVEEWRIIALCFGAVLIAGIVLVVFPGMGASFLTMLLIAVFLMEGAVSILLGLRMRRHINNWLWIIFSGVCSLILGVMILMQWPETSQWVLGFLVGLNFLSTGVSLIFVSRAARKVEI